MGAGPPYRFQFDAATSIVNGCQDKDFSSVDLTACLADAAYSSHLKFTTDRVIALDDLLFEDGFESGP